MKMLQSAKLVMAAALLTGVTIAKADILSGVGYGPNQSGVTCYLFNTGPGSVSITSRAIYAENGSTYQVVGTCATSLAAGQMCFFSATIPASGGASACHAVISPSAAGVRGEIEIRNVGGAVLNSGPLR